MKKGHAIQVLGLKIFMVSYTASKCSLLNGYGILEFKSTSETFPVLYQFPIHQIALFLRKIFSDYG
jgi:hypothetical protein